ncbi:MAG: NADH-quinone oxidoreductase subunit D [Deltaproteobacteria bacterium]|nr:NADH-quinone oxidoreductase subunit D [Deltaproteobacteria bacterium]
MDAREIYGLLVQKFPEGILEFKENLLDPAIEVKPQALIDVAFFLKAEQGLEFDYLRCLSGVDLKDQLEVVYQLHSIAKGHDLVIKVKAAAGDPVIPSVSGIWKTANWHEREAFDLLGINFQGHDDLRRILLPEDWIGHPLKKDYVPQPEYHGITPDRPDGLDAIPIGEGGEQPRPPIQYLPAMHGPKDEPEGKLFHLNMGPHHPSTHGVLNFMLNTDGEVLSRVVPEVGYLHRGMEKLAENLQYSGNMPYTDRIDYLGSMFCNHGWAMAIERLLNIEVPKRAEYCRVIVDELNRIASHLIATGSMAMDVGAFTPFTHWLRERETINDIMEMICGARLTYNYMRIGGVSRDISPAVVEKTLAWLDHFDIIMEEFDRLISENQIFIKRLAEIAVISAEDAIDYGLSGPNLRASGVDFDIRRDEPYSVYPELDFDVITGKAWKGSLGDCYDRYYCRMDEMRQSVRILRQALKAMPEGDIRAKVPKTIKPDPNEVYSRVESARGELGYYVVSDGSPKPYRAKYRTGSFTSMSIIEHLSPGLMVADLVALIASFDVVAPEVDR